MRTRFFHENVGAGVLFVMGILVIPALLFQPYLPGKIVQTLLAALLAALVGKRIKWVYFLIMVSSITFFNLLTPIGRVLLEAGPVSVTEGALRTGLLKGFTIVGLVFVSLASVRRDLRIPGRLGGLIGRVFFYFERVLEGKKRVEAKRLIGSIDDILIGIYVPGRPDEAATGTAVRTTVAGRVVVATVVVVHWSLLVVGFLLI